MVADPFDQNLDDSQESKKGIGVLVKQSDILEEANKSLSAKSAAIAIEINTKKDRKGKKK